MKKRVLVLTGGGDCPGLNAVIRGIVKRASMENDWEVVGSIEAYNGVIKKPYNIKILDKEAVAGIHFRGGTIIKTTNKGGPFAWPVKNPDGSFTEKDVSQELLDNLKELGIEAVISIGGDGSQKIAYELYKKGLNIIGVPKTIDNDLYSTDYTFGFQSAVDVATDAIDKLITTAESHNRVFILELMGRDAGWITLNAAIAGGAEVCIIPEIPYNIEKIKERLESRFVDGQGFGIVVVAEGAKNMKGETISSEINEIGYHHKKLGGISEVLKEELKASGFKGDIRTMVLGHLQRGGTPTPFDRILATQYGVKAFEMVLDKEYGQMVAFKGQNLVTVPIVEAISKYKLVDLDSDLIKTARGVGICFGD